MLSSKEKNILSFLDGSASEKMRKSIKDWAYESVENAEELTQSKKIYKESDHLKDYNPVDENFEWDSFISKVTNSAEEKSITEPFQLASTSDPASGTEFDDLLLLRHLDGILSSTERTTIDAWLSESPAHRAEIDLTEKILKESSQIESYVKVDSTLEWAAFQSKIGASDMESTKIVPMVPEPTYVSDDQSTSFENTSQRTSIFPMWARYAVAASIVLLLAAFLWIRKPVENYETFVTTDFTDQRTMIDGTIIELAENSTIKYPKTLKGLDERRLYLDGNGKFSVTANKEKKFFVEAKNGIGVEVIGTIFKVYKHEDFLEAVENIEGKVRVYSLEDPSIYRDLEKGQKVGWDGSKFVDLNEIVVQDNSQEYQILYVLDFLMQNSAWKVISSPNMPFDEKGIVKIDLEKPVDQILEDLRARSDFDYIQLDCNSCYQITRFAEAQ